MTSQLLAFQLAGPMASWGTVAVAQQRPTQDHPTKSAIVGLLSAALGYPRRDARVTELSKAVKVAVWVLRAGTFLRDYHTVQVAAGKREGDRCRADELVGDVTTSLTYRDYYCDVEYIVVVSHPELEALRDALTKPAFPLALGRKSCPIGRPPFPKILEGDLMSVVQAYVLEMGATYRRSVLGIDPEGIAPEKGVGLAMVPHYRKLGSTRLYFDDGLQQDRDGQQLVRDEVGSRDAWQYSNRTEAFKLLSEEETNALLQ